MRTEHMPLMDRIIDEAENLATERILNDPSDETILDAIREIIGVDFHSNSTCALLAIAAYNRIDNAVCNIRSVTTV